MTNPDPTTEPTPEKGWRKVVKRVGDWLAYKDKEKWLNHMRGNLSLVASIIATMTFQFAINPPGGVLQATQADVFQCVINKSTGDNIICPGEAVLATIYSDEYRLFLIFNTICFVASLSTCLLLVSGFPLNHRLPTWVLSMAMCITVTSLALTYLFGAKMVTPVPLWETAQNIFIRALVVWIILLGIVGLVLVVRLCVYGFRKWKKCTRQ